MTSSFVPVNRESDIGQRGWTLIEHIEHDLPPVFSFLDLGGGVGSISDFILRHYTRSSGVLLDQSRYMLARNAVHPRKTLVLGSAFDLSQMLPRDRFELIVIYSLLHHLVGDTYAESVRNVRTVLSVCRDLLSPGGRIGLWENVYDSWTIRSWASHSIYYVTRSRRLRLFARLLGANSNGVGICPLSLFQWMQVIEQAGLRIANLSLLQPNGPFDWRRYPLLLQQSSGTLFWLAQKTP